MNEIMEILSVLALLVFVIGSMASMGLSLKMKQIIAPLKNIKLVILEEKIAATKHSNLLLWRRSRRPRGKVVQPPAGCLRE